MQTISLTIPYEPGALKAASEMLGKMATNESADKWAGEVKTTIEDEPARRGYNEGEAHIPASEGGHAAAPSIFDDEPEPQSEATALDHHGVAFDARFCADAKDPFYASGKLAGQWKKKRGVSEQEYEAWYASQAKSSPQQETAVNAAAAFGGQTAPQTNRPTEGGPLMVWISEKQTAGLLTQEQIDNAWIDCELNGAEDIFPPTPADVISDNINALYDALSKIAGA